MSIYLEIVDGFDPFVVEELNKRFVDYDRTSYDYILRIGSGMKLKTTPEKFYELIEELIKRNDFDTIYLADPGQDATLKRVAKTGKNDRMCLKPTPLSLQRKTLGQTYNGKTLAKAKQSQDFRSYLMILSGLIFLGFLGYVGMKMRKK